MLKQVTALALLFTMMCASGFTTKDTEKAKKATKGKSRAIVTRGQRLTVGTTNVIVILSINNSAGNAITNVRVEDADTFCLLYLVTSYSGGTVLFGGGAYHVSGTLTVNTTIGTINVTGVLGNEYPCVE